MSTAPAAASSAPATAAPSAPASPPPPPPMPKGTPRPIPPPAGTRWAIALIILSAGIPCSQTVPGPVSVVMNNPSPPNMAFLMPGIIDTSKSMVWVMATSEPDDTLSDSPSLRSRRTRVPPAFTKTSPVPVKLCSTKPSPPKNPEVSDLVKAISMSTVSDPARYALFWHTILPPYSSRSSRIILEGKSVPSPTVPAVPSGPSYV
mmetsp:Transcript_5205/g.14755  ORF Transcript_5205/g.14755 Transcript_5205/m.14755 type:complete len:204 (-) Transcript_5205:463-1074(-)